MDIITGEKIQNLCDYYLGTFQDLYKNPFIAKQKEKHILLENGYQISTKKIDKIFVNTDRLHLNFEMIYTILGYITTPFCLFLHNSDHSFLSIHLRLFTIPNLKKIYSQNLAIPITPTVRPLPIGIANSMWTHGNLQLWNKMLNETSLDQKSQFIYCYFSIHTNLQKRNLCLEIVQEKNIPTQPNLDYHSYLKLLSTFEYAICPEGNGLDTHRFWECLYLKVTPIVLRNYITEHYSQFFPIVLLDNWQELDPTTLETHKSKNDWNLYHLLDFQELRKSFDK